jgi:hypothetical protein
MKTTNMGIRVLGLADHKNPEAALQHNMEQNARIFMISFEKQKNNLSQCFS